MSGKKGDVQGIEQQEEHPMGMLLQHVGVCEVYLRKLQIFKTERKHLPTS